MIKGAITILLLGFALVFGTYYLGGYADHDPTATGLEAKAALQEGMTWEEVIAAAGNPMRFQPVNLVKQKIDGEFVEVEQLGAKIPFQEDLIPGDIANGAFGYGFIFEYTFSHQAAFQVSFDGDGRATDISDIATMADLLDMRG